MSLYDILDNEFIVSSYLKSDEEKDGKFDIPDSKINKAIEWSKNSMRHMIIPTDDIGDLEHQWAEFNTMIKKHRRESDWMSLELFGLTNQDHYQFMRMKLLHGNIDNWEDGEVDPVGYGDEPLVEGSIIDNVQDYYDMNGPTYSSADVEKAIQWGEESNRVIIVPTRTLEELESLWDGYNGMIKKHRRESDWMSEELFGLSNLRHYEYLKIQFLRQDIKDDDENPYGFVIESAPVLRKKYITNNISETSMVDVTRSLLEMSMPKKSIYEEKIINNVISDVMDKYSDICTVPSMEIPYGDLPMVDPDTMIDKGVFSSNPDNNFYGVLADNVKISDNITVAEWFESYRNFCRGIDSRSFYEHSADWLDTLRYSMYTLDRLKESNDESAIKAKQQSILELGWDPDIPLNEKTRIMAREQAIDIVMKNFDVTRVVDLREFGTGETAKSPFEDDYSSSPLKPVFVVLTEGATAFSAAIKTFTHDIYSHVSIAFDSSLKKMYSFGIIGSEHGKKGGFIEEDVADTPTGKRIGVFVFFVSDKVYNKIKASVETFKDNVDRTRYGYSNLFSNVFNIPRERDWKLVCSEFVDKILKLADIDITHKHSSIVTPSDMNNSMKNERRIYNLYQGLASKYNPVKAKNLIDSLIKKVKPLKEMNHLYLESEQTYLQGIIDNIHDIPMLMEMSKHIDIVKTPEVKELLENVLFESITLRPYAEAKRFPLEFDKEGNALIKEGKRIDYEKEYEKSHKLLEKYLKDRNHEGIKYELSKLWIMLCLIKETLNSRKFQDLPSMAIESSAEDKTEPKINNDFEFYMNKVLELEPNFRFIDYYESTPFSSATEKISAPTMSFTTKMIEQFIQAF